MMLASCNCKEQIWFLFLNNAAVLRELQRQKVMQDIYKKDAYKVVETSQMCIAWLLSSSYVRLM